jgi:hypothetical protein
VGGTAELPQLEHRDAQQLAQLGAQALRAGRDGVDVRVEAGPVTQHAVHEGGHETAVAPRQVGAPGQQVLGEHAVREAVALVELAEDRGQRGRGRSVLARLGL